MAPPILPMYKAKSLNRKLPASRIETALVLVFISLIALFFFVSIYLGSTYLQEHIRVIAFLHYSSPYTYRVLYLRNRIQEEQVSAKFRLPNTNNIIRKWSVGHLGGFDLTKLGPPPESDIVTTANQSIPTP